MSSLKTGIGTGSQLQNLEYTYDVLGNITKIIDDGEIMNFGYDSLSRLISASGAFSENYAYDNSSGNLISKTTNGQSLGYQYSDPNHPHAVTKVGNKSYGYDANGNMTSRDGKAISYDKQGNLVQYDGKRYVFDGDGRRVMTWHEDGKATITLGNYYEVDWEAEDVELPSGPTCSGGYCSYLPIVSHLTGLDLDGRSYYYAGALRIAMRDEERGVSWIYGDHLGSISVTADKNGNLTSKTTYTPWGTTRNISGSNPSDYGFTGQRKEDDIYYYGARWYDPAIGRFMQADTIVPLNVQGTQAFDRYAYVNNNPLRYTDPTGMWMCGDQYDPACAETPQEKEALNNLMIRFLKRPTFMFVGGREDNPTKTNNLDMFTQIRNLPGHVAMEFDPEHPMEYYAGLGLPTVVGMHKYNAALALADATNKSGGNVYWYGFSAAGGVIGAAFAMLPDSGKGKVKGIALYDPDYSVTVPSSFDEVSIGVIRNSSNQIDLKNYLNNSSITYGYKYIVVGSEYTVNYVGEELRLEHWQYPNNPIIGQAIIEYFFGAQ